MRIKEVNIERYGPLPPLKWRLGEGVQPVYGPNESGKTLTVEALLKRFAGEDTKVCREPERVEETPEGYVVFERGGKEVKLGAGATLSDLLELEPEELRNIFVVRNADLQVEDEFYEDATDRLAGLRTGEIRAIVDKLMDMGRLTHGLDISKAARYNKAGAQLDDAEKLRDDVKDYIGKSERRGIPKLEADLLGARSERARIKREIETLNFAKLQKIVGEAKSRLRKLNRIPEDEISSLKDEIKAVKKDEGRRAGLKRDARLYRHLTYLASIGCAVTFSALILAGFGALATLAIPGALLLGSIAFLLLYRRANGGLSEIESSLKSLIREGERLGLKAKKIGGLERQVTTAGERAGSIRGGLNQRIGVVKDGLRIGRDSPREILDEASERLEEQRGELGIRGKVTFSERKLNESGRRLEKIEGDIEELEGKLREHRKSLEAFSREAHKLNFQAFLRRDLDLQIENLEALKRLLNHLNDFTQEIGQDAELSKKAIEIFKELESEEEERISKLFGRRSRVSEIYRRITAGRYTSVKYDSRNRRILVQRRRGSDLPADKLSKGAADQLYLAIRMALGAELLKEEPSFFILDGALEFSDDERLDKQLDVLKEISGMGWQVVYLTSSKGLSKAISKLTGNKPIELERIP